VIVLLAGGDMRTWVRDIEVTLKPYALPVGAKRDQKSERSPGKRKTASKRRNISRPIWKTFSRATLPRTAREPGRGGSRNTTFRWSHADQAAPPTTAGVVPEDENWERIDHFLGQVVPVATAAKVRLACHPHDPYTPPGYRGVTRVLGTVEGLQRFVMMHESPYHGLNFCQGTVAEMLDDPGREIFEVIRWFGERGKIFNVHFRNIKGKKLDFMEAFPDEGDIDMPRALALYRDVGYRYMLMPDHVPRIDGRDPSGVAFAYCYGYIQALLDALLPRP
jgi:mannonate dehydratase